MSRPGSCYGGTRNSIAARALDARVWEEIEALLRDPARIRRQLAEVQASDPTATRRSQLERQRAEVESERQRAAEAIVKIADPQVSAPLFVTLRDLAGRASDLDADLAALAGEHTRWEQMQAHLTRLEAYAARVAANVASLTYDERRRTLDAFAAQVTVWKPETHADAETGETVRWEGRLEPFGERAITFTDGAAAGAMEVTALAVGGASMPVITAAYGTL